MTHTTRAIPVSEMPLRDVVSNYLALKRRERDGNSTAAEDAAMYRQEIRRREAENLAQLAAADARVFAQP